MSDAILQLGYLQTLESTAPTPTAGQQAFFTWLMGHALGWDETRQRVPRSTWYRHLRLMADAGLPVPSGQETPSADPMSETPYWFGAETPFQVSEMLFQRPGLVMQLVGKRFSVALPWRDLGVWCTTGRQQLEAWPVGSRGVICSVIYEGTTDSRWSIEVEHDDGQLPSEERWPRIGIADFLRHTRPEEKGRHG